MYRLAATAAFGLEASVKREAVRMGLSDVSVSDGRVFFSGGLEAVAEANLRFRCADRILIIIGEFTAVTFDELFEKTKALPWDEWITADGKFTV
ncbi:MAG: THUMP domain-containing protein, partial [Defluviitaleaceae bacterium]|nr:THUMP domain-containing protein [Defluviitaleaceae bacterium]